MLSISHLYVYPIKSFGGIQLETAQLTDRGIEFDRRWMLVDEQNNFLTQREFPKMALMQTEFKENRLLVFERGNEEDKLILELHPHSSDLFTVQVWDDSCDALHVSYKADELLSEKLNMKCRLVYMPDETKRMVAPDYATNAELTGFSDAFPLLMIGQASLDDLNSRLEQQLPMNRFRPNIVFSGGRPFEEDGMKKFIINEMDFFAVKPCARCVVTTTDQETGVTSKEPLKTLSTYRAANNKIYFGQNILYNKTGKLSVGDELKIIETKPSLQLNN